MWQDRGQIFRKGGRGLNAVNYVEIVMKVYFDGRPAQMQPLKYLVSVFAVVQ
jgi:hypothetical protein